MGDYYDGYIKVFTNTSSTSIPNLSASGISIYPNPTSGKLMIDNGELTIQSIEISDITGKVVKSFSNFQNSEIDLSNLNSGIYFIKLQTDKQVFTTKIVKE